MNTVTETTPELDHVAARLEALRRQRGWLLRDLAKRTGLSESYLSRLEKGERQPSVAALLRLARAFNVGVEALLSPDAAPLETPVVRASQQGLRQGNGLLYTPLSRQGGASGLQALKVVIPAQRKGDEQYCHDGEEWLYLLTGKLRLRLGERTFDLAPGDSAHFDAREPHRLIAPEDKDAEVLIVAVSALGPLLRSYL